MNANLPAKSSPSEIMETVLIKGDLSKLTVDERNTYYFRLCESVGLNPLTQPIEYINLNGKLRLYAKKDCTDQLRAIHKVSVTDMTEAEREGVYIVKCKVQNGDGRTDMAIGAVNIAGLKGEQLANAMMKSETKSKRRATLSICGLGILDETEVEDIPRAQVRVPSPSEAPTSSAAEAAEITTTTRPKHQKPRAIVPEQNDTFEIWGSRYIAAFSGSKSLAELTDWDTMNDKSLAMIQSSNKPEAAAVYNRIMTKHEDLCNKFRRESISTGTSAVPPADTKATRPAGYPNPAMDPEGFLEAAEKRMAAINDPEELARVWEEEIDPASEGIFKPDFELLQAAYTRHEKRLGAD